MISHPNNIMDIHKVFHMKGGLGDTSYSNNSSLQKMAAEQVKHIAVETLKRTFIETRPKSLGIADLGCSSGPNTLSIIKQLVDGVQNACTTQLPAPELRIYLNDLPTNDFNTVFQALPDLYRDLNYKGRNNPNIYIAGYPGTFYGRLFPDQCLHFVYSSSSLHWLSRVPPGIFDQEGRSINKKSICITERSPREVCEAYTKQFQEDFSLFLKMRSQEVVSGGRMLFTFLGRIGPNHVDNGISLYWELLYRAFATLVAQGDVEEEKLDSYEVHFYAASKEELENEVRKEGSFKVEQIMMLQVDKEVPDGNNYSSYGVAVARAVRSVQESMITHHFGVGEGVLDKLFDIYGRLVDQELAGHDDMYSVSALLILTKL